jgi:hypothetical protein
VGRFGGTNKINQEKKRHQLVRLRRRICAVCLRLDSGSRGKRSRERVSGINRSIELEIRRGTGALDHRRRLRRVREHGRNQLKLQHRL